jgi:hypothetical protein
MSGESANVMTECPRCHLALHPDLPTSGEVWLRVDTGVLYRVRYREGGQGVDSYWVADRIFPVGNQGHDIGAVCAIFTDKVGLGGWIRVKDFDSASRVLKPTCETSK